MIPVMAVKDVNEPLAALTKAQAALQEVSSSLERVNASLAEEREDHTAMAVSELAEKFGVSDEALVAFVETAGELLGGKELSVADARRAGMVAAARAAWENELGPPLSTAQVRELLGGVSRQRVDELLRARRLIGLRESSGRWSYPLFQFDDGRPIELLVTVFWIIVDGGLEEWSAASWCVSPDPALNGSSALRWCREGKDGERLLTVARQDAARFSW
jgi:hypothetical protein